MGKILVTTAPHQGLLVTMYVTRYRRMIFLLGLLYERLLQSSKIQKQSPSVISVHPLIGTMR